jgi:hypothetical protein
MTSVYSLKTVKAGAEFKKNYVFVKSSLDLYNGPLINADAVAG